MVHLVNQKYSELLEELKKQLNNQFIKSNLNRNNFDQFQKEMENNYIEIKNNLKNEFEKLKNDLEKKNNEKQIFNERYIKIVEDLNEKINKKDNEINKLKEEMSNLKNKLNSQNRFFNINDVMSVNFISSDGNIHYSIPAISSDIFAEIEEKLYKFYPKYRETNNTFLYNGNSILRFKTLAENKIENGIPITLYNNII